MANKTDVEIPGYNFTHTNSPQFPKRRSPHTSKSKYPDFSKNLPQTEEEKEVEKHKFSSKAPLMVNKSKRKGKQLNTTHDAKVSALEKDLKIGDATKMSHRRHNSKLINSAKPPINLLKNGRLNSRGRSSSRLMDEKQHKLSSSSVMFYF